MTDLVKFLYPKQLEKEELLSLDKDHNLDEILEFVKKHNINTNHPLFLNQLFGNTDELSIIAEKYIAENNTSMYTYEMAPVFTMMENEVTKKLQNLIGFKECDSLFLAGGSMCNIVAINTARYYHYPEIKENGNISDLIVITSDQSHYSIEKACILLGIGKKNLLKIKTNNDGSMNINSLDETIVNLKKENKKPFIIVGTAGTTVFSAFDSIKDLVKISKKHNIWLHIDGALGGSLIFNKEYNKILTDLNKVDSFCFNPHKMLNINLQCSILLANKNNIFMDANNVNVSYLFSNDKYYDDSFDSGKKYLSCGRRPDVFKFWLVWKLKGINHFSNLLNNVFYKAEYFKNELKKYPEKFKLIIDQKTITVCFLIINKDPITIKKNLIDNNLAMISYQSEKGFPNFFRVCFVNSNCSLKDIDYLVFLLNKL